MQRHVNPPYSHGHAMAKNAAGLLMMAVAVAATPKAALRFDDASVDTFSQKQCSDSECTEGCQTISFPLKQCISVGGGGSAIATACSASGLSLEFFQTSEDCYGASTKSSSPTNQCFAGSGGGYVETVCSSEEGFPIGSLFALGGERHY